MSVRGPSFDDLVGADLPAPERERLLRVHELLIEAGPPPAVRAPTATPLPARRRRGVLPALAAALALTVFALGVVIGDVTGGRSVDFVVPMKGTAAAPEASASLTVFELDEAGNWPMEIAVEGLVAARSAHYELWLTKRGELAALCGSFLTDSDGSATVPLNAPYRFKDFDGWVVVEEGSETPLLTA
jgi:hypothetical protein